MIIKYTQENSFSHYWPGWQDQAEAWQALMVTKSKRGDQQKQETSVNLRQCFKKFIFDSGGSFVPQGEMVNMVNV